MRLISSFKSRNYGRCGACMRAACAAALAAITVAAGFAALGLPTPVQAVAAGLAVLLAGNWLAHVAAFTARTAPVAHDAGRRRVLASGMRLALIGLVISVPVAAWSSKALAFCGQCTKNEDCGDGFVCRNTAAVNSGEVCNECTRA